VPAAEKPVMSRCRDFMIEIAKKVPFEMARELYDTILTLDDVLGLDATADRKERDRLGPSKAEASPPPK
jgi:hypothetical protein